MGDDGPVTITTHNTPAGFDGCWQYLDREPVPILQTALRPAERSYLETNSGNEPCRIVGITCSGRHVCLTRTGKSLYRGPIVEAVSLGPFIRFWQTLDSSPLTDKDQRRHPLEHQELGRIKAFTASQYLRARLNLHLPLIGHAWTCTLVKSRTDGEHVFPLVGLVATNDICTEN